MTLRPRLALAALALSITLVAVAHGKRVSRARTVYDVDWTAAGVGGLGAAGMGDLVVTGVSGPVEAAYLYWHGIDTVDAGGDASTTTRRSRSTATR